MKLALQSATAADALSRLECNGIQVPKLLMRQIHASCRKAEAAGKTIPITPHALIAYMSPSGAAALQNFRRIAWAGSTGARYDSVWDALA